MRDARPRVAGGGVSVSVSVEEDERDERRDVINVNAVRRSLTGPFIRAVLVIKDR